MSLDTVLWLLSQAVLIVAAILILAALLAGAALLVWALLGRPGRWDDQ